MSEERTTRHGRAISAATRATGRSELVSLVEAGIVVAVAAGVAVVA